MENPSRETMAKLAESTYKMGDKKKNKSTRVQDTQNGVIDTGYVVNPQWTNSEITTYQHRDNPKNVVIAHRGTSVGNKRGNSDLKADLALAFGQGDNESTFRRRKQRTNKIINALEPEQLHLTGHSLGGSTVNNTIAKSRKVQDNLTSAMTFNAGMNPIFSNGMKVSKKQEKQLKDKVQHHRIKNDPVSAGFKTGNVPFGKLKTHSVKHDSSKGKSLLQNIAEVGTSFGRAKRFTEKGIHAHMISHFHDGSIKKKKKKKS